MLGQQTLKMGSLRQTPSQAKTLLPKGCDYSLVMILRDYQQADSESGVTAFLRDYQQEISDAIVKEWQEVDSTVVVVPTGGGKTEIGVDVIRRCQPARALVLAHREELIWQWRDRLQLRAGLEGQVEMANCWADSTLLSKPPVVISTVQTQVSGRNGEKRMRRFNPMEFGVLVVDECHHGTANTYRDIINYYTQNKDLRVVGFTATPDRADEEALGQVFKSVAADYEILDLIHEGWLVNIEQQFVQIDGLDYSGCRTTAGDLNAGDLAQIMEAERILQGFCAATIPIVGNRRFIMFTSSVIQAEASANIFNRHRNGMAQWICGKTDKDLRRQYLSEFKAGKIQGVANCGVLTEGFDDPGVEAIVMARPTKSRSLYSQMCGRSTRPLPGLVDGLATADERKSAIAASGKPTCLIVDFVGNSGKHKLMSSADILGGKVSERAIERATSLAKKLGKPVNMTQALDEAEEDLKREEIERARRLAEAEKRGIVAKATYSTRYINPFSAFDLRPAKERGWDIGRQLSPKQRNLLQKQGIDPNIGYAQGRQVIAEMFRRWNQKLCTVKQAALLKRFGYDTKDLKMEQATQMITALKENRWRRV